MRRSSPAWSINDFNAALFPAPLTMVKLNVAYLYKELTRRKARSLTSILAVAILVAIFLVLTSVMNAYSAAIYLPFQGIGTDMIVQKSVSRPAENLTGSIQLPFGKGIFDTSTVDRITALPHVKEVSRALLLWRYDKGKFITIEGIDPASFTGLKYSSWITAGRALQQGDRGTAVTEKHFAKFYGLKPGDSLQLGDYSFDIVGTVAVEDKSQVSATNVYISLADAQQLYGKSGCSQLYIRLDSLSAERVVRSEITQVDHDALTLSSSSIAASLGNYTDIYEKYQFLAVIIIALILSLILFQVNTAALRERRHDIGILQAVGWTRQNISSQIVVEIFIQTLLGFLLGLLISLAILLSVGSISVQAKLSQGLGNDLTTLAAPLQLSITATAEFLALVIVISVALSWLLSRRLAAMKPVDNLKNI